MRPNYAHSVAWVVHNRGGGGGHRCELSIAQVSGWIVTRLIADLWDKPVNAVAADIIDLNESIERRNP